MQHGTARAHGIVTLLNMQFMVQESVQLADGIPVKHGGGEMVARILSTWNCL